MAPNEEVFYMDTKITRYLDQVHQSATEGQDLPPVAIVEGLTGSGKTAQITSWLQHNKMKYYRIDVPTLSFHNETICDSRSNDEPETFKIAADDLRSLVMNLGTAIEESKKETTVKALFTVDEIDRLDDKDLVVYLNDYDKSSQEVRDELLKLIRQSLVFDPRLNDPNGYKKVNFRMLIIEIDTGYVRNHPLSDLEMRLFGLSQ